MDGVRMWRRALMMGAAAVCVCNGGAASSATAHEAASAPATDNAALFGAREGLLGAKLSPDGLHVLYLTPDATTGTALMVVNSDASGQPRAALFTNGKPDQLRWCDWVDNSRIVCSIYLVQGTGIDRLSELRLVAVDMDGKNLKSLAQVGSGSDTLRFSQYDGAIIDWMEGRTGKLLMERDHVPERDIGTRMAHTDNGLGVDLVDTRSLAASKVEQATQNAVDYISDGKGVVRIMQSVGTTSVGMMKPVDTYYYRTTDSRQWKPFSSVPDQGPGLRPLSVDPALNVAYCLDRKSGRDELFRVALDGSMRADLVYSDPNVDVDDIVRLGRQAKLIGVTLVGEKRHITYFDKEYEGLAAALQHVLPGREIDFVSSSADEQKLLVFAGNDVDPGRYYVFDRPTKHLNEIALVRPQLEHVPLAVQQPITFRASDGTEIPAYLTMPVNGPKKGLPAIVMPHGGPSARDEWGFDWLPQFFASEGFAVLQPNYRGSAGYGEAWLMKQGFQSWRTAIGDVVDAGRWLVSSGIAAPDDLAIVGWSYGGYAALQSNVVAPDLFKAVVAIAPVTDFDALRQERLNFTDGELASRMIGSGPDVAAGSPARHAGAFKAPVLLFHGNNDLNVNYTESQLMNDRLRAAGKQSSLVVYDGLDHALPSSEIRTDMLRRADSFLKQSLYLGS
jgi:dipeptidyl aminopeptidase/acylaminoacyl peptidase